MQNSDIYVHYFPEKYYVQGTCDMCKRDNVGIKAMKTTCLSFIRASCKECLPKTEFNLEKQCSHHLHDECYFKFFPQGSILNLKDLDWNPPKNIYNKESFTEKTTDLGINGATFWRSSRGAPGMDQHRDCLIS